MITLFDGKSTDTSSLRHHHFTRKFATTDTFVTPKRLPSTLDAAKYHCQRVYYQLMVWMNMDYGMDPSEWGWQAVNNKLIPMMMQRKAAPENLLKVIHCNCLKECKSSCCSCKRYELQCTAACGRCQTENCNSLNNTQDICIDDESSLWIAFSIAQFKVNILICF